MLLETKALSKHFGGLKANDKIDFHINHGEIVAIIGPNGSGKTTFYNIITGIIPATSGQVLYRGEDITNRKAYQTTKMGITRTFQNIRLFGNLTVAENLIIARHCRRSSSLIDAFFSTPKTVVEDSINQEFIKECLDFVGIYDKRNLLAKKS